MCNETVKSDPWMLKYVPDQYKTQGMCNEAVQRVPWMLKYVPDQYKTREMCNEAVQNDPWMLEHVPDPFLRWYKEYEQRKAQRRVMPVVCHPDRWWNGCVPEHEIYFA